MILYLILVVVVIVLAILFINPLINAFPKSKIIISVILVAGIIVLGFFLFESIMRPIRFEQERRVRFDAAKQRLIDIRTAQEAYKERKGEYAENFDKLIGFVKVDSFEIKKPINKGWDQDMYTEKEALRLNLLEYEFTKVSVKDSLFPDDYPVDSLRYVPFTDGIEFQMDATELVTPSKVKVKVFEAKVHNNVIYNNLDRQLVINMNDERRKIEKYPGLQVGSLTEPTGNAGNWE